MKKYIALGSVLVFTPLITFAAATFGSILDVFDDVITAAIPIVISLAVLFFIISLLMYILREGEEKAKAKTQMIWGIIILFSIVAVWGLVGLLSETFGIDTDNAPTATWNVD